MSAMLKVVIVIVSLVVVSAGGYWVFHRQTVRIETTPPSSTPSQGAADDGRYRRLREAQGSIDKLKPLELPVKSPPAAPRASEAQR